MKCTGKFKRNLAIAGHKGTRVLLFSVTASLVNYTWLLLFSVTKNRNMQCVTDVREFLKDIGSQLTRRGVARNLHFGQKRL